MLVIYYCTIHFADCQLHFRKFGRMRARIPFPSEPSRRLCLPYFILLLQDSDLFQIFCLYFYLLFPYQINTQVIVSTKKHDFRQTKIMLLGFFWRFTGAVEELPSESAFTANDELIPALPERPWLRPSSPARQTAWRVPLQPQRRAPWPRSPGYSACPPGVSPRPPSWKARR